MQPYNFVRILFETVLVFGKGQNDEIHDNLPECTSGDLLGQ